MNNFKNFEYIAGYHEKRGFVINPRFGLTYAHIAEHDIFQYVPITM